MGATSSPAAKHSVQNDSRLQGSREKQPLRKCVAIFPENLNSCIQPPWPRWRNRLQPLLSRWPSLPLPTASRPQVSSVTHCFKCPSPGPELLTSHPCRSATSQKTPKARRHPPRLSPPVSSIITNPLFHVSPLVHRGVTQTSLRVPQARPAPTSHSASSPDSQGGLLKEQISPSHPPDTESFQVLSHVGKDPSLWGVQSGVRSTGLESSGSQTSEALGAQKTPASGLRLIPAKWAPVRRYLDAQ